MRGTWTCQICKTKHRKGNGPNGTAEETVGAVPIGARHTEAKVGVEQDLVPLLKQLHDIWFQSKMEIRCPTCKDSKAKLTQDEINQERLVESRISRAPEYLMFQVFSASESITRSVKCSQRIRVPLWLDLTKYKERSFDAPSNHLRYKLCTTIYHWGGAGAGHYFGVYASPNGVREINNTKVWSTDPEDLSTLPEVKPEFKTHRDVLDDGTPFQYLENHGTTPYLVIYKRLQPQLRATPSKEKPSALAAGPSGGSNVDRSNHNGEQHVDGKGSADKTSKSSATKRTSPSGASDGTSTADAGHRRSKRLKTKK